MLIGNIIMDFRVILFIFNCWMNWWMWMIENGIIRFLEKNMRMMGIFI